VEFCVDFSSIEDVNDHYRNYPNVKLKQEDVTLSTDKKSKDSQEPWSNGFRVNIP
jgi:hypothetical protein